MPTIPLACLGTVVLGTSFLGSRHAYSKHVMQDGVVVTTSTVLSIRLGFVTPIANNELTDQDRMRIGTRSMIDVLSRPKQRQVFSNSAAFCARHWAYQAHIS